MAASIVRGVLIAGGTLYAWQEGYITKLLEKFNEKNSNNNSRSLQSSNQQSIQPIIVTNPETTSSNKILPFLGISSLIAIGYLYYSNKFGTKQVIDKVETTSNKTQNVVKESDTNNAKRFIKLDERNQKRNDNMETEIRAEQRAGFTIISDQLYTLTQVCVQAFKSLSNDENIEYLDKAEDTMDTILDDNHRLKLKQNSINDIRTEINNRNTNEIIEQYSYTTNGNTAKGTPGGPNDDISEYTSLNYSGLQNENENENEENVGYIGQIKKKYKTLTMPIKFAYNFINGTNKIFNGNSNENNYKKEKIIAGAVTLVGLGVVYKYASKSMNEDKRNNVHILQM